MLRDERLDDMDRPPEGCGLELSCRLCKVDELQIGGDVQDAERTRYAKA